MVELLVNEYSRKNFVDGRVLRLPTICVRPGRPNQVASSFVTASFGSPSTASRWFAQFRFEVNCQEIRFSLSTTNR